MEIPEEEVRFLQKIGPERNCFMETQEKEMVPQHKSGIRAHPEGPASEKKLRMETKNEAAAFEEMALRCVRLGPRKPASCRRGVLQWLRLRK